MECLKPICITLQPENGTYTGSSKDGLPDGEGKYVSNNGYVYIGPFKKGSPDGHGILESKTMKYTGDWINGTMEGVGICEWSSGNRFCGNWKAGKCVGEGMYLYKNGDYFNGYWENNKFIRKNKKNKKK